MISVAALRMQQFGVQFYQASLTARDIDKLVRFEVDRALGVVGLATADEVNELTNRVRDLERQLREAETRSGTAEIDPAAAARRAANKKAIAEKATAEKLTSRSRLAMRVNGWAASVPALTR